MTYHITTKEQLQAMNDDLAGDYILDNDIDLTGVTWTPIGSSATPFTGTFDGQGFTLSNLEYDDTTSNSGAGLFGHIKKDLSDIIIKNLSLDGFAITGGNAESGCLSAVADSLKELSGIHITGSTISGTRETWGE